MLGDYLTGVAYKKYGITQKQWRWIAIQLIVFFTLLPFFARGLFVGTCESDGFCVEMAHVMQGYWKHIGLYWVHFARYIAIYPMWTVWQLKLSEAIQTLPLLIFLLPVLFYKEQKRFCVLQLLILYACFFVSYRTVLVTCSLFYMYVILFSDIKSKPWLYVLYILSFLFANLSSGVLGCWIIINLLFTKTLMQKLGKPLFIVMFLLAGMSFSMSLMSKYFFVHEQLQNPNAVKVKDMHHHATIPGNLWKYLVYLIHRNTIYTYIMGHKHIISVIGYIGMVMVWIFVMIVSFSMKQLRQYALFFAPMLLTFFVEGLGTDSFVLSLGMFVLYKFYVFNELKIPFFAKRSDARHDEPSSLSGAA